jgi:hypothetical protein
MKKKLTALMVMGAMTFALLIIAPTTTNTEQYSEEITSEEDSTVFISTRETVTVASAPETVDVTTLFEPIVELETENKDELNSLILECNDYVTRLNVLLEDSSYTEENVILINNEIARIEGVISSYEDKLAIISEQERIAARWEERASEYPVATKIWLYMKNELGWNDYVCAGVMGNLMTEVGGQTLNIDYTLYGHDSKTYYGICQWSSKYYPEVKGQDLDFQLNYLKDTVEGQFNTYGYLYQSNMKYDEFTQMTGDPRATALAFAKVYERCNSKYYTVRQDNAETAYEYFTD